MRGCQVASFSLCINVHYKKLAYEFKSIVTIYYVSTCQLDSIRTSRKLVIGTRNL